MSWVRQHTAEILITALVIAVGAGVFLYAHKDVDVLEQSRQRGADIVRALEQYHAAHGTYPDSLLQLVPDYTSAIEPPTWGVQRWSYQRYTAAASGASPADTSRVYFQLSVPENPNGYPVLYYDIIAQRWVLNN